MKETFFFSHDYNARNDRKMLRLKVKLKMCGVGIYWSLIEMLYEEAGALFLDDIDVIADELRTEPDKVLSVIKDFELFRNDGEKFWSESVISRLEKRQEKSKKAKDNAEKRWGEPAKRAAKGGYLFYVIRLYKDGESFIKCGTTSDSVNRRFSGKTASYKYEILYSHDVSPELGRSLELQAEKTFERYMPNERFAGYLECFHECETEKILNFAMQRDCKGNAKKESKVKDIKEKENKEEVIDLAPTEENIINLFEVLEAKEKEKEKSSAQKEKSLSILLQSGRNPIDPIYETTWAELCIQPNFLNKNDYQLQRMCMDLMDYDEQFAINLMKKAIRNGYKDVIFDNTKTDYLKNQQHGNIKHIDNAATRKQGLADLDALADRVLAGYQS